MQLDLAWSRWFREHIQRGTSPAEVLAAMVAANTSRFKVDGTVPPLVRPRSVVVDENAAAYSNDNAPIAPGHRIDAGDRIVEVLLRVERPCVVLFNDVLSHEECDALIERARLRLERSGAITAQSGPQRKILVQIFPGRSFCATV